MPPQAGTTSRERFHLFCVTTAAGPSPMMSMSHGVKENATASARGCAMDGNAPVTWRSSEIQPA
jgi:hypothetical protein